MKHTKHTMRPVRPAVVKRLSLAGFVPAAAVVSRRQPGASTAIINLEATPTTLTPTMKNPKISHSFWIKFDIKSM